MGKKVTCKICHLQDHTGITDGAGRNIPADLDSDIHEGFTVGKGKVFIG